MSHDIVATTIRLDNDIDPVLVGSRSGLLWVRGDLALAGVGEALRIPVERPSGGVAAQQRLAELAGADAIDTPGTGPVAFGAFPFDRQAPGELIVPEIVVGRGPEGRRWITIMAPPSPSPAVVGEAEQRVVEIMQRRVPAGSEPTRLDIQSALPPETWRDEIVSFARDRLRAGDLDKVVLARELILRTDHPIDEALVVDRLRRRYRSAITFLVDGFVGASPELLVKRSHDVVSAHPLAGTAPRASDPAADAREAANLLASDKNRWEHAITINWLLSSLLPLCSYVDAEPEPSIVTMANVHHLGTRVEGRLSGPAASILELVETLHPTPAVGGAPQHRALEMIEGLERADRGRYAGPTGWVDGPGNGEFAVSVRSAQIGPYTSGQQETRLFAGVGVVADSDPEAELAETRSKFEAMLGALIRP